MAEFYKVLTANPLGDPYTPSFEGAKATQTFWCQLEGVEKDVSIGKQVPNVLSPGESIYGDLMYAKSQKGTEYWKFKSAKVPEGVQRPASTPAQATAQQAVGMPQGDTMPQWFTPVYNMIKYIHDQMKAMDTDGTEDVPADKPEQISGEPITPEDKAVLDGIFTPPATGEPEPPEEK